MLTLAFNQLGSVIHPTNACSAQMWLNRLFGSLQCVGKNKTYEYRQGVLIDQI